MSLPESVLPKIEPDLPPEIVEAGVTAIEAWCQENGQDWGDYLQGFFVAYSGDLLAGPLAGGGFDMQTILRVEPHVQLLSELAAKNPQEWRTDFSDEEKRLIANEFAHINSIVRE